MKVLVYHNQSDIINYLMEKDPKLVQLFQRINEIKVSINERYFESLIEMIIAQQLSSKVATVISKRVYAHYQDQLTPERMIETKDEVLRSLGLSYQKIAYIKSLASSVLNGLVDLDKIHDKTDQEIIDMLIQVKGIGIWTAHMFLIFSVGREDIFSVGDLGLRNAVKKLYGNENLTHDEIIHISSKWSPYRSIVSHYLWHAWDNE